LLLLELRVTLHHLHLLLSLHHLVLLLGCWLLTLLDLLRRLGRLSRLCLWRDVLLLIRLLGRRLGRWL
jgi:hypothetical protein